MAIESPLLEISIEGATPGVLYNVTGGMDLGMVELDEAARVIAEAADPDANIIFGATIDEVDGQGGQDHPDRDRLRRRARQGPPIGGGTVGPRSNGTGFNQSFGGFGTNLPPARQAHLPARAH